MSKKERAEVKKEIGQERQSGVVIPIEKSYRKHLISIFILIALSAGVYSNSLLNGFVYDDAKTIVNNTLVKNFSNLSKLLTKEYFLTSGEMSYRPVVTFTYFLDYWLYGLRPYGYHLTNLLLHSINGVLLYIFLTLLFKSSLPVQALQTGQSSIFNIQLIISLLFITHPVLTEAVNAISFREDLLCFMFFISALIIYVSLRHPLLCKEGMGEVEHSSATSPFYPTPPPLTGGNSIRFYPPASPLTKGGKGRSLLYALSCILYLLALLSKEMAITFPLIIILYGWLFPYSPLIKGDSRGLFKGVKGLLFNPYIIGYIAITIFYLYLRFYLFNNPYKKVIQVWTLSESLVSIPYLILKHLFLLIIPVSLSADYVITPTQSLISFKFIIPLIIVSLLVAASIILNSQSEIRNPKFSFAILFFLITLLPVFNIVPIANPFAERYLYLPMVGFAIVIGIGIHRIFTIKTASPFRGEGGGEGWFFKRQNLYILAVSILILSLYSFAVIKRNTIWADNYSLWTDTVVKMPNNFKGHNNLGNVYNKQGLLDNAIKEYLKAIELNPDFAEAHNNLGEAYNNQERTDDAIREYLTAIKLNPNFAEARNNLGRIYDNQGRTDDAIREYLTAIKLNPYISESHYNLGSIYNNQDRTDDAIREYLTAIKLNPDFAEAHNNLGRIYDRQGRIDDAINEYLTAIKINPNLINTYNNLGNAYAKKGQIDEAIKALKMTLKLKPDHGNARFNLWYCL